MNAIALRPQVTTFDRCLPTLVLEVRWGSTRVATRSLRGFGKLCIDVELADMLQVPAGTVLATFGTPTSSPSGVEGRGFTAYLPGGPRVLTHGTTSFRVGDFTVELRVDEVPVISSLMWLWLLLTPVVATMLYGGAKLMLLLLALLLSLFARAPESYAITDDISGEGAGSAGRHVSFSMTPAPKPVPMDLHGRLELMKDPSRMNEVLAKPMAPRREDAIAPPPDREVLKMVGVLSILGSSGGAAGESNELSAVLGALDGEALGGLGLRGSGSGGAMGGLSGTGGGGSGAVLGGGLGLIGGVGRGGDSFEHLESRLHRCGAPSGTTVRVRWPRMVGGELERTPPVVTGAIDADARRCIAQAVKSWQSRVEPEESPVERTVRL